MGRSTLENLGQGLLVGKGEIRQLKRQRKLESIFDVLENEFVKILAIFSAVWGAIIPIFSVGESAMGYPMFHGPPGGYKAPVLVFGAGVGTVGIIKGGHIILKNPPDKKHQLFMVRAVVTIVFLAFCAGYAFGFFPRVINSWSLYNVYSRDEDPIV